MKVNVPEDYCVGVHVNEALFRIAVEHPGKDVVSVPHGDFVTADLRADRVRVYYNPDTNSVTSVRFE